MPVSKQKSTKSAAKKSSNKQEQRQTADEQSAAIKLCPKTGDLILALHVRPGAKLSQLTEIDANCIGLSVAAPPIDGQANAAVIEYLASILGCRRADVDLQSGAKSRDKLLRVSASVGFTVDSVRQVLSNSLSK